MNKKFSSTLFLIFALLLFGGLFLSEASAQTSGPFDRIGRGGARVIVNSDGSITFRTGGSDRRTINSSGHDLPASDNLYDLGPASFCFRSGYFGTSLAAPTLNGNTFTAGSYTLTGGAGKTFTFNNTLTLSGTDGSTLNVGAGGSLGSNAFTSTAYAPLASPTFS